MKKCLIVKILRRFAMAFHSEKTLWVPDIFSIYKKSQNFREFKNGLSRSQISKYQVASTAWPASWGSKTFEMSQSCAERSGRIISTSFEPSNGWNQFEYGFIFSSGGRSPISAVSPPQRLCESYARLAYQIYIYKLCIPYRYIQTIQNEVSTSHLQFQFYWYTIPGTGLYRLYHSLYRSFWTWTRWIWSVFLGNATGITRR